MDFEVYCDESRTENFYDQALGDDSYVLIGGLWIEASEREDYKAKIKGLRETHNVYGEFKWNRVSPSRQQFYLALVRLFFEEAMRFRCMVLPVSQLDAIQFHQAGNELMFYKFYYQLLHHWILDFNRYCIFVDFKSNRVRSRLRTLRSVLQNANITSEILAVQALPSNQVDLLQLVDVLIGAVGYRFHQQRGSTSKLAVLNEIEDHLGHPIQPTPRREGKFNVFRFRTGGGW
jgi:hypothetical protein